MPPDMNLGELEQPFSSDLLGQELGTEPVRQNLRRVNEHLNTDPPTGAERVFIVDDEPLVRRTTHRLLESLGYQVQSFSDGQGVIEHLGARAACSADLVVTDYDMPNCSGYELAQYLRRVYPTVRVLLYSSLPEECIRPARPAPDWPPFLAKPFRRAELAYKLREVLDGAPAAAVQG